MVTVIIIGGVAYYLLAFNATEVPTDDPASSTETDETTDTISGDDSEGYMGLTEAQAAARAESNDVPFRVVERDGESLPVTEDWRPGRINAAIEDGVVVSYTIEGNDPTNTNEMDDAPVDETTPTEDSGEHDAIIGMTEGEAQAYAEANSVPIRVGYRDGEPLPVTMDYRPGRITMQIENGVVTDYTVE